MKKLTSRFAIHEIAMRHFKVSGPGTLVYDTSLLIDALEDAHEAGQLKDPSVGGKEGQMAIPIPVKCVIGAFALLEGVDLADIKAGIHRGHIEIYVPREKYTPVPVASATVILYTRQALKDDPEWDGVEPKADYTIVTILANTSPEGDPVSAHRFASNLAGGNNRYLAPDYTLERAREEAKRVAEFEKKYIKLG